jgi:hypothetical protein
MASVIFRSGASGMSCTKNLVIDTMIATGNFADYIIKYDKDFIFLHDLGHHGVGNWRQVEKKAPNNPLLT